MVGWVEGPDDVGVAVGTHGTAYPDSDSVAAKDEDASAGSHSSRPATEDTPVFPFDLPAFLPFRDCFILVNRFIFFSRFRFLVLNWE